MRPGWLIGRRPRLRPRRGGRWAARSGRPAERVVLDTAAMLPAAPQATGEAGLAVAGRRWVVPALVP